MMLLLIKAEQKYRDQNQKTNEQLIGEEENKVFLIYNLSKKMENKRNMREIHTI